jgi:hypothetical protein
MADKVIIQRNALAVLVSNAEADLENLSGEDADRLAEALTEARETLDTAGIRRE